MFETLQFAACHRFMCMAYLVEMSSDNSKPRYISSVSVNLDFSHHSNMSFLSAEHLPGQSFRSAPHYEALDFPGSSAHAASLGAGDPTSHTQQPVMTGTSVLGIKYDGGVMLAADNLGAYWVSAMPALQGMTRRR